MQNQVSEYSYCESVGEVSQGGWLTSLDTTETSATEKTEWINRKLQLIHSCGSKVILTIRDGCLTHVAVPIRCHSPLCPTCARMEQEETLRKYKPILEEAKKGSRYALFVTLTTWQRPKDGDELRRVYKDLSTAYRKLLDMRLGPRKRKWLREYFYQALELSEVRNKDLQRFLFEEFLKYCEENKVEKFRDLIKVGVRRPELTWSAKDGWFNPHFHVLWFTDCPIPQVLLSLLWTMLTGSGIVDIRQAYDDFEKELLKYMTKWWDIPEDKYGEALWGLKGMKKVMVHGVRLLKEPKRCPHCNREDCKAHPVAIAELERPIDHRYRHGDKWEGEIVSIRKRLFVDNWCLVVEDPFVTITYTEEDGFTWEANWISFDLSIKHSESVWIEPEFSQPSKRRDPPQDEDDYPIDEELLDF